MGFRPNSLFYTDGYKIGHKRMLAEGTTTLYGTWIPRSLKYAPKGINKILSFGQQLVVKWLHDEFTENFFNLGSKQAIKFAQDMSIYLNLDYDGKHFEELHKLQYLPIKIKSLPEGIETNPNIPHMTFINTVDGFAWLTLYLETIISSLAWKSSTSASIALQYKRNCINWVEKTDKDNLWLTHYMCHDFSARGLDPFSMLASGLGHATSHRGSDTLICIPGARYYYNEPEDQVCINSVNASEHSVSTTKIFTVGEKQMIIDWLIEFPTGILSIVADTFDLWKLIVEYLQDPKVKELILARDGKLVIRPDSGDPEDIICGRKIFNSKLDAYDNNGYFEENGKFYEIECERTYHDSEDFNKGKQVCLSEVKGVIELLWDIFGGTINSQGYKVLDSHIGAIYGDSINLDRQVEIYKKLSDKGFASTNIVLGVGSFTYQFNTRDTFGFAAKGAWFQIEKNYMPDGYDRVKSYNIYKDPITDDGTKKSLKGLCQVYEISNPHIPIEENGYFVKQECTKEEEEKGLLQVIYQDGRFYNQTTLSEIRERIKEII